MEHIALNLVDVIFQPDNLHINCAISSKYAHELVYWLSRSSAEIGNWELFCMKVERNNWQGKVRFQSVSLSVGYTLHLKYEWMNILHSS